MRLSLLVRIFLFGILVTVPLLSYGQTIPTRVLSFGARGIDVYTLQVWLNKNPDTEVSQNGPGSPGMESSYFGLKTMDAVQRFQEKYASSILIPLGLTSPTGVVGQATLLQLKTLAAEAVSASAPTEVSVTPIQAATTSSVASPLPDFSSAQPLTPNMVVPPGTNPNSINLNYAVAVVDMLGKQRQYDPTRLAQLEAAIRTSAATSTNYAQFFFNSISATSAQNSPSGEFISQIDYVFKPLLSFLGLNNIAHAAGIPFGTPAVLAILPCTCSGNIVDVFMIPLLPTEATTLAYVEGTQLYSYYTVSHPGQALKGFYTPPQVCYDYVGTGCVTVPTFGVISPEVGSSL